MAVLRLAEWILTELPGQCHVGEECGDTNPENDTNVRVSCANLLYVPCSPIGLLDPALLRTQWDSRGFIKGRSAGG